MKSKFFIWSLINKRINNTMDALQRRFSKLLQQQNWCVFCNKNSEDGAHLFLYCSATSSLWNSLQRELNLSISTKDLADLYSYISSLQDFNTKHKILLIGIVAILWSLWIERNNRICDSLSYHKSHLSMWEDCRSLIGYWCNRDLAFNYYSATTIALNLNVFCI